MIKPIILVNSMATDIAVFADELRRLPDIIRERLNLAFKEISEVIVQRASTVHRFQSRTGKLVSSIKSDYTDTGVRAYLDTGVAKYATYVHEGQRSWAPDPFLTNSFNAMVPRIDDEINRALDEILERL